MNLRRTAIGVATALAMAGGLPACGGEDAGRAVDQGVKDAKDAGRDATQGAKDAKDAGRDAVQGAKDAGRDAAKEAGEATGGGGG